MKKALLSGMIVGVFLVSIVTYGTASAQESTIPAWIKNNADWWTRGLITDKDFAAGLGYMIKEGIIKVDDVEFDSEGSIAISDDIQIPKWIHNNAKWWVDGAISDDDFKYGIQYMVKEKVIDFTEKKEIAGTELDFPFRSSTKLDVVFTLYLADEVFEKVVESTAKIVVADVVIHGLLLEANNYAIKMLDDKVDDAWNTYADTKDKNDMNRAVALDSGFTEGMKVGTILLTELKQTQRNSEQFFDSAQKAGFDKFALENNANSDKCSTDDVSQIRDEKDFDDAKEQVKDCQKVIKITNEEISRVLLDNPSGGTQILSGSTVRLSIDALVGSTAATRTIQFALPSSPVIIDSTYTTSLIFDTMENDFSASARVTVEMVGSVKDVAGTDTGTTTGTDDTSTTTGIDDTSTTTDTGTDIGTTSPTFTIENVTIQANPWFPEGRFVTYPIGPNVECSIPNQSFFATGTTTTVHCTKTYSDGSTSTTSFTVTVTPSDTETTDTGTDDTSSSTTTDGPTNAELVAAYETAAVRIFEDTDASELLNDQVFYWITETGDKFFTAAGHGFNYRYLTIDWEYTATGEDFFTRSDGVLFWVTESGETFFQLPGSARAYRYLTPDWESTTGAFIDQTPPTITAENITIEAVPGAGGKVVVVYTTTATDNTDPDPTVECSIPNASIFDVGTTTVTCTATDSSGNTSTTSFTVTVTPVDTGTTEETSTGTDDTTTPITVSATPTSVNQDHTVGSTSCPQSIDTVTLNSNQAGTWSVTSKPSWTDVTISSNQASISFNCNISNVSTHTESGSISFSLDDSSNTSIGSVSVSVSVDITAQTTTEQSTWIPTYVISNQIFPQKQFSWSPSEPVGCPEWHIHATQLYNTDAQLVSITDPDPSE